MPAGRSLGGLKVCCGVGLVVRHVAGRGASGCPPPALRRGPARLPHRRSSGLDGVLTRAPNLARIHLPPGVNASFPCRFRGGNAAAVVDLGAARCRGRAGSIHSPHARPQRRKAYAAHSSAESSCQVVDPSSELPDLAFPGRPRRWCRLGVHGAAAVEASRRRTGPRRRGREGGWPAKVGPAAGYGAGSGFRRWCAAQRRRRRGVGGGRGHSYLEA
jgi:hypothetical protein